MVTREAGPEQSEGLDWRALIDCSPVATWAEDLSAIARRFDELRAAGVVDAAAYFSARPEELSRLVRLRRVVAASRPALVLFGTGDAEALRERVYDVVDEPSRAALASELAALWRGETLIETEWRVQERVLSRRLAAATMSARGIGHVILAAADITEQRRTERELRFARFAVDRSHIPLFWIFSDASFFYVNEAACASLGYTREGFPTRELLAGSFDSSYRRPVTPACYCLQCCASLHSSCQPVALAALPDRRLAQCWRAVA